MTRCSGGDSHTRRRCGRIGEDGGPWTRAQISTACIGVQGRTHGQNGIDRGYPLDVRAEIHTRRRCGRIVEDRQTWTRAQISPACIGVQGRPHGQNGTDRGYPNSFRCTRKSRAAWNNSRGWRRLALGRVCDLAERLRHHPVSVVKGIRLLSFGIASSRPGESAPAGAL